MILGYTWALMPALIFASKFVERCHQGLQLTVSTTAVAISCGSRSRTPYSVTTAPMARPHRIAGRRRGTQGDDPADLDPRRPGGGGRSPDSWGDPALRQPTRSMARSRPHECQYSWTGMNIASSSCKCVRDPQEDCARLNLRNRGGVAERIRLVAGGSPFSQGMSAAACTAWPNP